MALNKNGEFDASEVAAYIVAQFNEKGMYLDHLKLQKLLYFICLDWIKEYQTYPYKQAIEMWKLGPVIRSVYSEYRTNGYNQIAEVPSSLKFSDQGITYKKNTPANFSTQEKSLVDKVIERLGKKNSFDLVDLTHEHGPWSRNEKLINSGVYSIEYEFEDFLEIIDN